MASFTEAVLERADATLAGARGYVSSALVTRRGLTRAGVEATVARLRRAADILEELIK